MEELLFQNVLAALAEGFPEVMTVTERIKQGFAAPCFRLTADRCAVRREMGDRYRAEAEFSLWFYPEAEDAAAASALPGRVQAVMEGCAGFSGMESQVGEEGEVRMKLAFSAIGFWAGPEMVLMDKMGLALVLGAGQGAQR